MNTPLSQVDRRFPASGHASSVEVGVDEDERRLLQFIIVALRVLISIRDDRHPKPNTVCEFEHDSPISRID